jgi:hypothetical protein
LNRVPRTRTSACGVSTTNALPVASFGTSSSTCPTSSFSRCSCASFRTSLILVDGPTSTRATADQNDTFWRVRAGGDLIAGHELARLIAGLELTRDGSRDSEDKTARSSSVTAR